MMGAKFTIVAALFLLMCGEADPPTVTVEAEPPNVVEATGGVVTVVSPAGHGGTSVSAGPHQIEVVSHADGTIEAYVVDDTPPPPSGTQVTVRVPADDGAPHPVVMIWDPSQNAYRGRLRQVQPAPGAVEVIIVSGGHTHRGRAPRLVIIAPRGNPPEPVEVVVEAPPPPPRAGGPQVVVVAPPRPRGPTVVIDHPNPRPGHIVVEHRAPRPGRVVVEHRAPRPGRVVVRPGRGRARGHARGRRRRGRRGRGHRRRGRH